MCPLVMQTLEDESIRQIEEEISYDGTHLPIFLGCSCSSGAEARLLLPVCQSPRNSSALSDSGFIVGSYLSASVREKQT